MSDPARHPPPRPRGRTRCCSRSWRTASTSIVREMTNTLLRSGRSAVLNMARDFSCSIVTADDQLLAAAEGLQVHVLGAGPQTAAMRELHGDDLAEGDAFLHNDPYLGNTHAADHTILVPVFCRGRARVHRLREGPPGRLRQRRPTTYMPVRARPLRGGRAELPVRPGPARLRATSRTSSACAGAGSASRTSGTATTSRRSAPRASASGGSRSSIERYGLETIRSFIERWLDYSERRMGDEIGQLPATGCGPRQRHDPMPGAPRRRAGQRRA